MAVSREDNVYDAHITYLDKDGPCIKVFAQPNNNTTFANNIERIIYKLRDKFNKHEVSPNTVKEILIGETCCAKFDDGNYYRAKVVNLDQLYSHRVVGVHFIDHGNSANVKPDDIVIFNRLLQVVEDEKKPGVEYLMVTPPLANEYLLQGLNVAQGKEWDDGTIKALRNKYCNTDVRCNLFEFNGKKIMRIVQYQSADPMSLKSNFNRDSSLGLVGASSERRSQLLKTEQPRLRHNLSMPPPSPISLQQALPSNRFPNLSQPPPMVRMADPNYGLNVQPFKKPGVLTSAPGMTMKHSTITNLQSTPVQNLQFSSEMLTPGVSHPVFVSHVEDGPCAFAVQIQSVVSSVLTKMMAEINNSDPKPITAPLNPGSICLARYSNDGSLCRAIVTGHMPDSKVKLYFADFGNTEVVAHSDIFQIPPEFVIPKVMSHRFTLANIRDKVYTDFEKKLFKDLVNNCSELLMKVTPPEANPLKQYCELFRNCKNIKVIMDEMVFEQPVLRYLPVPRPTVGSQEKVYVPFVLNPGRFFVQLSKNSFTLQQVMSCVANHCRTASPVPLVQQRVGEPCCAMYEDETWYRAEIIHLTPDNKAFVNFVDYGNQDDVELDKLRQATTELITSVKAQAIVCCLKGYETRYDVDEMISNRLEELILEQTLTMHVVGVTGNNVLIVQLQDSQGQDIFTLLEARPATVQPQVSQAVPASDGYEESSRAVTYNNSYQEKKFSDSQGTSEENRKSWRSRDDGESAPRHKDGGGHWNENIKSDRRRDEEDHSRSTRIDPEDKGKSRSSREEGSGGWNSSSGGRFSREEDGGARSAAFGGSGRFNNSSSRFNREDGGGRVNQTDEERTYRKREEDSGGWRNKDRSEGGSWKDKENRGGWRDTGNESNQSGGYKERSGGGGGGWNDGSGDSGNKFNKDSGFKRGGYNQEERSSFRQGSGDGYRKPAPKTPKPNTVGGMPQPVVKIGTTQDTQVVYTTSPVEFYVQLTSSFDQLNELMERIATACESGSVEDMTGVQVKAGCLAKYSEDDTWYRAVTEEISFDSAKVLFVDYGNREAVPFDKIKVLPEDMTSLPVQAVKCRLYGVVDSAEVEAFSALVDAKNLKTQFVAKHFSTNSFEVVLVDEDSGSNINTAMGASADDVQTVLSKLGTTSLSHQQCASGLSLTTQMTWYISPAEFYLQVMNTHPEFRAMMQSMQSIARSGKAKQTGDLSVGDFVIARFKEDKALYRALVKESGFVPNVQYVDYGNIETVESGSLWAMEEEYATLPIQALKCCLAGVRPTGDAWPKGGTTQLDGYFESDTLECSIVQEVDSQCLVRLTKEGQDVAQSIIDAGLALPDSDVLGSASELDPALLPQQLLPVSILRVEDNITFFVQPTAEDIELQSLETVAGEGIKCVLSSVLDEETVQLQQLSPSTNVIVHVESVTPNGLTVTLYDEEGQIIPGQTNDAPSVDKICPLPVLSTHQKVYVSHACPQGIYLQKSTFADHLSDLVQRLYDFYNETESIEKEWKTADFCSAKSVNDEQWYRAIILEPGDEEINVQYVDYGNCETVPVSNVRQLDKSFYTPHALCLKVSLHVTWTVPEDNLLEIAGDTEYSAVVLRGSDGWVVELIDGSGLSLTDRLVELGFATALENSPFKRVVEGGRFVEGSTINISVSFIDSPLQLWIFVGDDIEQIEALQDRLQEAAPRLSQLTEPTGIFAAKFSDDLWYRATLLENSTVRFIDYGNSDDINLSDIKELSADFLEPAEGFAVKVELPVGNCKPSATDRLNELLISPEINSEEEIVAHILSVNDSYIVADILKGGKSVVDILVGENLVTKVEKVCSGFISHLNSLNDFFIQETSCVESLESISNAMLNAEGFELVAQINEGDIVAALYTVDGLWYRARVTKKSEDEIVVLFIDYGNSAVATDFRSLPSDTIEIPPLSKRCTLQLPNSVTEWSETANEKFVELSAEGCTQFDVKVLNREDIATVMLSCNGKCVTEELRPYCKQENEDPSIETSPIDLTGYDTNVYVSLLNSPNDFYVQVEGAEVELDNIREELADPSSFEKLEEITNEFVGKTIGAFIADHELWYRVKVINVTEVGTEVLLVDYGNTMTAIDFVVLPEHLESREPLAIHCSFGLKNFSEEALAYFTDVSGAGTVPFLMKIVSKGDPNIVSLILEDKVIENELSSRFGKSVADVIIEEVLEDIIVAVGKEPTTENIPEKSDESETTNDSSIIKTVFLIQVNSPSDFFLHTAEATQELEEISEWLTTAADFPPADESSLSVGSILAGQIDEDDLWYRAKITDLSENEIKVLFIDYGTIATVAKVHSLPKDILSIPPLAMRCALSNIDGSNWSVNECEIFNKLANDDNVSFDLKILTEGEQNLVELFANGESVTKQLRAASGLAAEESSPEEKLPVDEHLVNEESASEETLLDPAPFAEASSDVQEPTHVKDFSENSEQSKAEEKLPVDEHFVNEESASEETLLDPAPFAEASSDVQEPTHVKDFSENSEQSKAEEKLSSPVKDLSNKMEQIKDEMRLSSAVKYLSEKMEQNADETKSLLNSNTHEVKEAVDKTPCSLMNQNNTLVTSFEINKNNDLVSEESVTENTSTQHIDEEKKDELADDKVQDNLYCDMREIAENLIMKTASYKVPSPKDSKSDVNGKHESDEDEDYDTPDEEKVSSEKTVSEITSPSSSENGHGNETCKSEISFEEVKTDLDPCGKIVGESPVIHPSRSNIDEKLVPGCISSVHLEDSTKQS